MLFNLIMTSINSFNDCGHFSGFFFFFLEFVGSKRCCSWNFLWASLSTRPPPKKITIFVSHLHCDVDSPRPLSLKVLTNENLCFSNSTREPCIELHRAKATKIESSDFTNFIRFAVNSTVQINTTKKNI